MLEGEEEGRRRPFEVVFYCAIGRIEPVSNALNELYKSAKHIVEYLQETRNRMGIWRCIDWIFERAHG